MRQLNCDELDMVSGGLAGYDSADDASFMSSYEVRAAEAVSWMISDSWAAQQHQENEKSALDALAKSVGLPDFNELQRQAAMQQQQTCQTDPLFATMMQSPTFKAAMDRLIADSKASGHEYAINYYGNGNWSDTYTSREANYVNINKFDLFNFFRGWADVVIHTHFDAVAGLSPGVNGDIGASNRLGVPIVAVDYTQRTGTEYYCYNPNPD